MENDILGLMLGVVVGLLVFVELIERVIINNLSTSIHLVNTKIFPTNLKINASII